MTARRTRSGGLPTKVKGSNWGHYTEREGIRSNVPMFPVPGEGRREDPAVCALVLHATAPVASSRRRIYDVPKRYAEVDAEDPRHRPMVHASRKATPQTLRDMRRFAHEYMQKHPKGHVTIEYRCKGKEVLLTTCGARRNMVCQNHVKKLPSLKGLRGTFTQRDAACNVLLGFVKGGGRHTVNTFPMTTAGHRRASAEMRRLQQTPRYRGTKLKLYMSCTDDTPVEIDALAGLRTTRRKRR